MTLCAILFYAQGSYQRPLGRSVDLNLSQASVSESLTAVTDAFNHPEVLLRFLKFPRTRAERNVIIERNTIRGFPGVLGYVDGSLVGLASPHGPAKLIYRSRKGFYAINTLVVCDADLNILYFNAQFPGSAHDSWVYRRAPIRNAMREAYRDGPCWLLGDSAYPHEPWLMKPILEAAPDSPEWRYTRLHCRGRSSVERCIGVLKGRWRCLLWERSLHYQPDKAGKIAQACVVLHNLLRARNVADPEPFAEDDNVDDHEVEELEDELAEANRNRNHLVQVAQQRHQQQHQ